jgi:hypothetical protein
MLFWIKIFFTDPQSSPTRVHIYLKVLFIFLKLMHFTKVEGRLNHFCNGHVDDGGENGLCSLLPAHKNPAKNVLRIKFVWIKSALQEKIYRNTYVHIFETQCSKFLER